MIENIIFAVLTVIAIIAGIWAWWLENHSDSSNGHTEN